MAIRPKYSGMLIVVTLAVLVLVTVGVQHRYEIAISKKEFRRELNHEASVLVSTFGHKMMMYYQGLKIIARMPAVRSIEDNGANLDEQSRWVLKELYSSLSANIDVSEVYVITLDFDPGKIDVRTGRPFEPAVVLDEHILEAAVEGEESYEYRQILQHLQWMKRHAPTEKDHEGLGNPGIIGEQVITCDDRDYTIGNHDDKDRSGIIYSVPFYSIEGKLKGLVAGVILTNVLKKILPSESFVIRNNAMDYSIETSTAGTRGGADQWIKQGKPDPELIYSEVLPLKINDKMGDWVVWGGVANDRFWSLSEVKAQQQFTVAAYFMVVLVSIGIISNLRKQRLIAETNIELKHEMEERKDAQRSLEQYSARLGAIFTSVTDGIISSDEKGKIDKCNPAIESLFGYEKGELIGKNISIFMTEPDRAYYDKYLSRFIESNASEVVGMQGRQLLGLRKDGSTFPVEITVNSAESGGRKFFVAVMRDLTERKMAEQHLARARDAALESSRLKSELLANVSHELRTPMNGIIGCAELLKDTTLDDEQSSYLKILFDSSSGLVTIMDDLMDFSRLDADKLVLKPAMFGIRESVDSAIHLLADVASEKGLDLKVEYADDLPDMVYGDTNRLRQVLTNLLGNAVKFTGQGGVTVRASLIDSDGSNQIIRFEVSDTGIGISKEHHRKIFESFVQADGSITRDHGGMGLGLAICSRLIEAMHGEIGVNSDLGKGTTFWFWVPFRKEDSKKSVA